MTEIKILAPMGSRSFFGAERANIDLLWRMQQRGAEVLCLVRHEDWPENIAMRAALTARGLAWEQAPFPDYPSIRYWRHWPRVAIETPWRYWRLNRCAEQAIRRCGFTHLHLFNPFQAASLFRAIARTDIPVVYRCGDHLPRHNMFYRRVWSWLSARVAQFVTESDLIRSEFSQVGVDPDQVRLFRTPPPARHVEAALTLPITEGYELATKFCYIGQFAEHKGIDVLLQAFATVLEQFPSDKLFVAAPIADEFARSTVERWSRLADSGAIWFLDAVEDIPGLLSACDVHVAPTLTQEPYGLVVVEAKAAALPSIVFAEGGLAELVVDGQEGIALTEKSPHALADAMLVYCRDPARAKADGRRAHASLTDRLKVDQHDDAWLQVYAETAVDGSHKSDGNRR